MHKTIKLIRKKTNGTIKQKQVFYGEHTCEATVKKSGKPCSNSAYYNVHSKVLCGVHSKKNNRITLPKNPNKSALERKMLLDRQILVQETAKTNRINKHRGSVVVNGLRMMKAVDHIDGTLKVFPNFKHQNRKDGFGCASLSPKSIGPIDHNMPGLPIAMNLENYHQGAKVFMHEISDNAISQKSLEHRVKFYQDTIPHRHKFDRKTLIKLNPGLKTLIFHYFQCIMTRTE